MINLSSSGNTALIVFMIMEKSKHIDIKKKYEIPTNISIVRYKKYIIVISVDTANWIVLQNDEQLTFFELLKNNTIQQALNISGVSQKNAVEVVTQLEAKKFENKEVITSPHNTMQLYLTNKCNMRCPHCYMFAGEKLDNELTTYEVCNLLKEFSVHGGEKITMTGGEVSTRTDLEEIIRFGAETCKLQIDILTNGIAWTDEMIDNVSPYIHRLQVSLDGFNEFENAKVRGKGHFALALHTIDRFLKSGVATEVAITPWYDETLVDKISNYAEFGKTLKEKYSEYKLIVKYTTGLLDGRELKLTESLKNSYSEIMSEVTNMFYGKNVLDESFIASAKMHRIFDNCTFGCLSVSANGDVYACNQIHNVESFGNIRINTFEDIWLQSKKAQEASNIKNLSPCNKCPLMYICGGNCRIKYFKEFKFCKDFSKLNIHTIQPRLCSVEDKEHFYDIMIRTNKRIYQ